MKGVASITVAIFVAVLLVVMLRPGSRDSVGPDAFLRESSLRSLKAKDSKIKMEKDDSSEVDGEETSNGDEEKGDSDDDEQESKSGKTSEEHKGNKKKESDEKEVDDNADETSGSSKDEKETPLYDRKGWHLHGEDFVAKAMHPERLQPFYLMPMFFAVKLILTMLIFGYSLRFTPEPQHTCLTKAVAFGTSVGKAVAGLGFIGIALLGYKHDYQKYLQETADIDNGFKRFGVLIVLWVTSANYVACRALWGSLMIENPVALLQLKPKYAACPVVPIPVVPCGARWLDPLKHIYALLLFPYYIPYVIWTVAQSFLYLGWLCTTKCGAVVGSCYGTCSCFCALVGTILTLGLVAWTRDALQYWWVLERPLWAFVATQIWASFIAPMIFSFVYGILLCSSPAGFVSGIQKAVLATMIHGQGQQGGVVDASDEQAAAKKAVVALEKDDADVLKRYNAEKLKGDFLDYDEVSPEEQDSADNAAQDKPELADSKIQIFASTLAKMSSIVVEQLATIFLVRAVNGTGTYDDYMGGLHRTLTERTIARYMHNIEGIANHTTGKAINAINMLL